jgi:RND family efflux transporter MFP subunit
MRFSISVLLLTAWTTSLAGPLPHMTVAAVRGGASSSFEARVEALRQTQVAAQVAGAIVGRSVEAGDRVGAGQVLFTIDARAASENVAAGAALSAAAKSALATAAAELERKRQLHARNFVAKSALDQAQAAYDAASAQVDAALAQANASRAERGHFVVRAPYAGVVSAVHAEQGDIALPGRALATVFDPAAMRVTAAIPASAAAAATPGTVRIELPSVAGAAHVTPAAVQLLPTVDPQSMTRLLRADLPRSLSAAVPGMFARVHLALSERAVSASVQVPARALVRRGELTAVYVLDAKDRPLLRQVRIGDARGADVQILSGLDAGERVVTDPQSALRPAR